MFPIANGPSPIQPPSRHQHTRNASPPAQSDPDLPSESVQLSSPASSPARTLGKVLVGAGALGFTGLLGGVLAGVLATPALFVGGAVACVVALGTGGLLLDGASRHEAAPHPTGNQMSTDGTFTQQHRVGPQVGVGGTQQTIDYATGQTHQQVNVGGGYYLDPSTGRLVYQF